jgi:hypothetical protein
MARLRVGDIEIDGSNVTIGGVPQTPATPATPTARAGVAITKTPTTTTTALARPQAPPPAEGLDALATFPIGHRLLIGGGGLAIAAAAVVAATQAVTAAPLLVSGVGAIVVGLLKRRALRRRAAARARAEAEELGDHASRLRPLLGEAKAEQTIEWITERSGLAEAAVVRTLVFMRDRGEIVEELNTETGEWYYGSPLALPAAPRALDERLAALEQGDRKS